jgi:hypothetical protein
MRNILCLLCLMMLSASENYNPDADLNFLRESNKSIKNNKSSKKWSIKRMVIIISCCLIVCTAVYCFYVKPRLAKKPMELVCGASGPLPAMGFPTMGVCRTTTRKLRCDCLRIEQCARRQMFCDDGSQPSCR